MLNNIRCHHGEWLTPRVNLLLWPPEERKRIHISEFAYVYFCPLCPKKKQHYYRYRPLLNLKNQTPKLADNLIKIKTEDWEKEWQPRLETDKLDLEALKLLGRGEYSLRMARGAFMNMASLKPSQPWKDTEKQYQGISPDLIKTI